MTDHTTETMRDRLALIIRDNLPATNAMDTVAPDVADAIMAALPGMVKPVVTDETAPRIGRHF